MASFSSATSLSAHMERNIAMPCGITASPMIPKSTWDSDKTMVSTSDPPDKYKKPWTLSEDELSVLHPFAEEPEEAPLSDLMVHAPFPGGLTTAERFWRDQQPWLKSKGYTLRQRYQPDWQPSWLRDNSGKKQWYDCEDGIEARAPHILDAVHDASHEMVLLKCVSVSLHPFEIGISLLWSSKPLIDDPKNHCIRINEVLDVPGDNDKKILVMPLLRPFDSPPFQTVGEVVGFLSQIFDGLEFMHTNHVAHRDCMGLNIMMDPRPMYPQMFHPRSFDDNRALNGPAKHHTRTARPPRYYFIDFGISLRFDPDTRRPLAYPIWGGDKTVPEYQDSDEPCDPFPPDIYYLGNMIRTNLLSRYAGLEFLTGLARDMVHPDPAVRLTIVAVQTRFKMILKGLNGWKFRSRLRNPKESADERLYRFVLHALRTAGWLMKGRAAIPRPRLT